nr:PREDICTED: coiled-coil domain-containing protein 97 [Bemisia tabaci]
MECEDPASGSSAVDTSRCSSLADQQKNIIDQVVSSEGVHFKSQQIGDPELQDTEKRKIVEDVLNRSHGLFLSKFGQHLCQEHLEFFSKPNEAEQYEVDFYLRQLRKNLKKKASKMCIKNRRFDALKKMVTEGTYFSEEEMRKRNPLLYEQLVGQYLSEEEKRMREEIDTSNITIVNLLMEQMDREDLEKLKKTQEEDEDCAEEEEDTSDEEEESANKTKPTPSSISKVTPAEKKILWGEMGGVKKEAPIGRANWIKSTCELGAKASSSNEISDEERSLLFDEFRNNMFENFLQGKDSDFDYSKVDCNPELDDIETMNQDAEDKYFDSETPETGSVRNMDVDSEEDEFEKFMSQVRSEERTNHITSGIKHLNSDLGDSL